MSERLEPDSAEELRAIVADALASKTALEILGGGSMRGIGRPVDAGWTLSTVRLSGVSLYEPEELVLRAGPGTPMEQLRLQLEQHGQMLAFEPPDYGALLGGDSGAGTIGGIVASNLAGPRRIKAGAARDHFLGIEAVSGRGEAFKSGGRVVKNVTGYDMCKLMCGAWGTLCVMTEVTLKVLPAPEKTRTVLVVCDTSADAVSAMTAALSSPQDISGAAWLPREIAALSGVSYVASAAGGVAALRLEGIGASVDARCAALRDLLAGYGAVEELHTDNSLALWRELRDVRPFAAESGAEHRAVWKISVPPTAAPAVVDALRALPDTRLFLDWGGGLIWAETDEGLSGGGAADAGAAAIRAAIAPAGGHATLIRGSETLRRAIPVFQPEAPGVAALSRNIKTAFDPENILNPGRMYAPRTAEA